MISNSDFSLPLPTSNLPQLEHSLNQTEHALVEIIHRFQSDFESAEQKTIDAHWQNEPFKQNFIHENKEFIQKYTPVLKQIEEFILAGTFKNTQGILPSLLSEEFLKEVTQIPLENEFLYQQISADLSEFNQLIATYKDLIKKYKFVLIDRKLGEIDYVNKSIHDVANMVVNTKNEINNQLTHLSPYDIVHCYGKDEMRNDELILEKIQEKISNLPEIPKMPRLARVGQTSRKILIKRMQTQCECLKDVLRWHYQHRPLGDNSNLSHSTTSIKASEAGIFVLYEQVDAFQKYLDQPLHLIEKSYLSHCSDMAEKVEKVYLHHLRVEDQAYLSDYFKIFLKECRRLHTRLAKI